MEIIPAGHIEKWISRLVPVRLLVTKIPGCDILFREDNMSREFEALYEKGVFRPLGKVKLKSGSVVRIAVREVEKGRSNSDLADVEKSYALIDSKYPDADVRSAYRNRDELHQR